MSHIIAAWSTAGEAGNSIGLFCPDLDAALVDAAAGKSEASIGCPLALSAKTFARNSAYAEIILKIIVEKETS